MRAYSHRYVRILAVAVLSVILAIISAAAPCEALSDSEMAQTLAEKLGAEFLPESLSVRVLGSRGFAEARGIFISGVRVDRLSLEAILTSSNIPEDGDIFSLANIIDYSWGEVEFLAADINDYFKVNEERGFSNLVVSFSPGGFYVETIFSASFLFRFRIRLSATGTFGLRPDGVYIENPVVYIERIRQPGMFVNEVLQRANPLLEWSEIPFRIVFREITMTEHSAVMSGNPRNFEGGVVASWDAAERRASLD